MYECRLKGNRSSVYIQRGTFSATSAPLVKVNPVSRTVRCSFVVPLTCEVNSPYTVKFTDNAVSGKLKGKRNGWRNDCFIS